MLVSDKDTTSLASDGEGGPALHEEVGTKTMVNVERAVFGVMYTLSKEKSKPGLRTTVAKIVIDFLRASAPAMLIPCFLGLHCTLLGARARPQATAATSACESHSPPSTELAALCLSIPKIPHYLDWIELRALFSNTGFGFYRTVFWLFAALLMACLGICGFVGRCFLKNHFPVVWPVRLLRNVLRCAAWLQNELTPMSADNGSRRAR